ncbi:hypothetical protein IFM89_037417 [Coptis chinensis]|uniref:Uncharacterized protein n=1 Tax=Coptis chinensis TaxID=261450 RepID=A0A835J065_9MAGN|nr:hypothetical protein IFM89_037417 [Coptis chinensis]
MRWEAVVYMLLMCLTREETLLVPALFGLRLLLFVHSIKSYREYDLEARTMGRWLVAIGVFCGPIGYTVILVLYVVEHGLFGERIAGLTPS